jgi:hypothetical protein
MLKLYKIQIQFEAKVSVSGGEKELIFLSSDPQLPKEHSSVEGSQHSSTRPSNNITVDECGCC